MLRREFLTAGSAACVTLACGHAFAVTAPTQAKIETVELIELHGRYTDAAGVNGQQQVNPLDVYDDLRPAPHQEKPSCPLPPKPEPQRYRMPKWSKPISPRR